MDQQQQLLTLELSHVAGQQLLARVEDLIERLPGDPRRLEWLEELVERVGCANAVALWLREYVHVDLRCGEAKDLLGLLPQTIAEGEWDAADGFGELAEVRRQLRQALRQRGTVLHA